MRRLIINADDFGLTLGVNRAIIEAHSAGLVTSSTLMATAAEFSDAVALAKSHPKLGIGCHVILVDGQPVLPGDRVKTLTDTSQDNRFRHSLGNFAAHALLGKLNPEEIAAEAAAQISKIQAAGIPLTHVDTHKHAHVLPQVLKPLLRAANSQGVRAVRNPFEPLRFSLLSGHFELCKQFVKVKTLHLLAAQYRREVSAARMLTCDGSIGIVATGFLDPGLLSSMINYLPDGTWELVCHPGYNDAQLDAISTRLRQSRVDELHLLTSSNTRDLLAKNGIQLISYADLV